ncbi:MAG: hypothetical protein LCH52_04790 [Bacteroidetes bacterium]|nr:hypothetical protein [Bacteroidota bacterium]
MSRKKIFLITGGVALFLIAGGIFALLTFGKPEYAGFRSFRVISIEDSTLKAEITIGIRNKVFFDITLEKLRADLVDLSKKIGNIAVDQKVVLPADSVADMRVNLTLNINQALKLFNGMGDTARLSVSGYAVAGLSFITLPVDFDIPVPLNIKDSLFNKTGSPVNDSIVSIKKISDISLEGDSIKFDLTVQVNNPYDVNFEISGVDSGMVMLGNKPAGKISLEESLIVGKLEKNATGIINAACYIGDLLSSGPSTLFGLFTSAGKVAYTVKGKLRIKIFDQTATIPLNYNGKFDIKEILRP